MKFLIVLISIFFLQLAIAQDAPIVSDIDDIRPMQEGRSAEIILKYNKSENLSASACTITSLSKIEIYKECQCEDGVCKVGIIAKKEGVGTFTYTVTADSQTSQNAKANVTIESNYDIWTNLLGVKGILILIFLGIFFVAYTNSLKLFSWVDQQTHGTRDYILNKFEILFIEVEPQTVTYGLLFLSFGLGILTFILLALIGKLYLAIFMGIVMGVIGWKLPKPLVDYFENRRKDQYSVQMVDALNLLANGLRAGLTVPQAIGMVVDELPPPVSQEFNLILQQAKIGVPLDEALENLKKRVYTEDNEMFVTSVNILRETGGNLAEVFDTIVGVIRERVRLHLKIKTYVKAGMFQAYTIGSMPFAMIAILGMGDPQIFPMFFGTIPGIIALTAICGLVWLGMWVIFKIIDIKV
ncbi:MAG: type II secretion system F family protein [Bdellovibrionota bacterium]